MVAGPDDDVTFDEDDVTFVEDDMADICETLVNSITISETVYSKNTERLPPLTQNKRSEP